MFVTGGRVGFSDQDREKQPLHAGYDVEQGMRYVKAIFVGP